MPPPAHPLTLVVHSGNKRAQGAKDPVNPAELVLLGVAFVGSAFAFARYVAKTSAQRERRRRQKLGAANAEQELQTITEETCVICEKPVQAELDIFDEKTNTWWHRACWRQSVR
ncbi:MAG: hypothetical protein SF187_29425 [Deltaproteobacteria bacterium]|nr:hypothetical protein [Deltaproteobacteria bacterium]